MFSYRFTVPVRQPVPRKLRRLHALMLAVAAATAAPSAFAQSFASNLQFEMPVVPRIDGCMVPGGLQLIQSSDEPGSARYWCGLPPQCLTVPQGTFNGTTYHCSINPFSRREPRGDPAGLPGRNPVRDPQDLTCENGQLAGGNPAAGICPPVVALGPTGYPLNSACDSYYQGVLTDGQRCNWQLNPSSYPPPYTVGGGCWNYNVMRTANQAACLAEEAVIYGPPAPPPPPAVFEVVYYDPYATSPAPSPVPAPAPEPAASPTPAPPPATYVPPASAPAGSPTPAPPPATYVPPAPAPSTNWCIWTNTCGGSENNAEVWGPYVWTTNPTYTAPAPAPAPWSHNP